MSKHKFPSTLIHSDLQGIRTNARRDGDDWILNGSKTYITNGCMSDVVIVVAVTDPSVKSKAHGISLFLVEEGMPGFKKGRKLEKMGMKAQVRSNEGGEGRGRERERERERSFHSLTL